MKRAHILPLVLTLCLICALAFLSMTYARMVQAERALEAVYQSDLSEAGEQLSQLRLTLDKLQITQDAAARAELLGSAGALSRSVSSSMSGLPVEQETLYTILAGLEAIARNADDMRRSLLTSGTLTEGQRTAIQQALATCTLLSGQLSLAGQAMREAHQTLYRPGGGATLQLAALSAAPEVPVIGHRTPLGLTGTDVSQEQALTIAAHILEDRQVQRVAPSAGTSGALPAYGITVETSDLRLNLEITVQGGNLLWMMPETAAFDTLLDADTCRTSAAAFLEKLGYPAMEPTGWQQYGGLYVVSFVPLQDGVLLYPDLVHVQVRMDTGAVVGFEADSYLTNHVSRSFSLPTLTSDEAAAAVAPQAEVTNVRLALLRLNEEEVLCHQVTATAEGETYLVFLDVQKGTTIAVQKLVVDENGIQPA